MQDLIVTRIYWEESEYNPDKGTIRQAKLGLDPMDVYFYEEYQGDKLSDQGAITNIILHSGEKFCIKKDFQSFYNIMQEQKKLRRFDAMFKFN